MKPLQRTFWLGAGLILLTNAVVLGGVYYNRSGEPESVLRLSERELSVSYRGFLDDSDDSSKVLSLNARVADGWVTADKLLALGFEVWGKDGQSLGWRERRQRSGLVVLELDGPAFHAQQQAAEAALSAARQAVAAHPDDEAQDQLKSAELEVERVALASRLYVVDAGLDAKALRARYPDGQRYALAHADLRYGAADSIGLEATTEFSLYVDLTDLNVGSQWREVFAAWNYYDYSVDERSKVSVELAFGKRFEPWIVAAQKR
ncbi:hypothetical protein ACVW0Y_000562 [Pseudomonas sp. TE3786]